MKKFTLFFLTMVLSVVASISSFAAEKPVPKFSDLNTDGTVEQYLYNVEFGGFLVGANDWGTRASVAYDKGLAVAITAIDGGTYKIGAMSPDGADGVWIDGSRDGNDKFTITVGEDKTFTIGCTKFENTILTWGGDPAETRLNFTASTTNGTWAAVSVTDFNEYVAAYEQYNKEQRLAEFGLLRVKADTEFTGEVSELDGKTLVLVDATASEKLLCNIGDAQDMVSKNIFDLEGTEYLYTKFAKADVEVEGAEGDIYTMQMFNKDGKNFEKWGTQGYVNFQPEGKSVVFALGLGDKYEENVLVSRAWGQDAANHALWTVEKTENGYTIKNVGRGTYFSHSEAVATVTEPAFFKFYAETEFYKATVEPTPDPTPDPEPTTLFADGTYYIQNVTLNKNLNIANEAVNVAEGAKVNITNVEGGFIFSNSEAQYVTRTTNTWSLSTSANIEDAYVVSIEPVEGGYEIKGELGSFGLDYGVKADDNTDETVYADKNTSFNGIWTIVAVTNDEPDPTPDPEPDPEPDPTPIIADGSYFIYNVKAGKYLANGAFWGTRSVLFGNGIEYNVSYVDGKYVLASGIKGESKALRPSDGFNDQSGAWEIVETEGGVALFNGTKYFSYVEGSDIPDYTDEITAGSVWQFVTADARKALLANATAENPVDATVYIKAPDFHNADAANNAWSAVKIGGNLGSDNTIINNCNNEKWNAGSFTVSQTITDIPNGVYQLTAQAYYRHGGPAVAATAHEEGTEVFPKLFANDESVVIKSVFAEAKNEQDGGWRVASGAYYIPDSQADAAACFETGAYVNVIEKIVVTDNTLTIGVTREGDAVEDWTVFDTFRLTYFGAEAPEPEPVAHENDLRLALTGGSGEGSELAIEVLETDEEGQPLSAKYTITDGTWGNNASHLSIFKYNLTPDMIKGYKSVIVEFAEALPVSEGNPEYGFIPCGFVCPEGWLDLDGKDAFELVFTDKQKTEGIADFSIFFNANGDVKNATFTIRGLWLVKDTTEQPDAIESVETEATTSVKKMMVDGKVVIVKGGKTYNVAGSLIK